MEASRQPKTVEKTATALEPAPDSPQTNNDYCPPFLPPEGLYARWGLESDDGASDGDDDLGTLKSHDHRNIVDPQPENRRLMKDLISKARKFQEPAVDLDAINSYGLAIQPLCRALEHYRETVPLASPASAGTKAVSLRTISNHFKQFLTLDPAITGTAIDSSYRKILSFFQGPPSSPYAGGIFSVSVTLPMDYPFRPPECKFLTKVYHPNIDSEGNICLDILDEAWSSSMSFGNVLIGILSILTDPGLEDPIVPEIAVAYLVDRAQFNEDAELHTRKYATIENALSLLPKSPETATEESDTMLKMLADKMQCVAS